MGDKFVASNMSTMLSYRMGWNYEDPKNPFYDVRCYKLDDERAVVFLIGGGAYYTIEDELALYPSDALITKIRLIGK